jgi:hypothetical protein
MHLLVDDEEEQVGAGRLADGAQKPLLEKANRAQAGRSD